MYKPGPLLSVQEVNPHWFPSILPLFIQRPAPLHLIYPSPANQHNVLHALFGHLMQKSVVLRVPKKQGTVKPRGGPFSTPTQIQQTWCAGILITSAHMCALLHHANDARPCAVPSPVVAGEKTRAGRAAGGAHGRWSLTCTEGAHTDEHRANLGD